MTADEYRARAEEMRQKAAEAPSPRLREEFLKFAKAWEEMALNADPATRKGRW